MVQDVEVGRAGRVFKLAVFGQAHLYRWSGLRHGSGILSGIETYVKDRGARDIIGRWLPCPNWCVEKALRLHIEQASA
jgi:hypothetical protein